MNQNLPTRFKGLRNGAVLVGLVAMLSLSACTTQAGPAENDNGNPSESTSATATADATDKIASDTGYTYPAPAKGQTTSTGEPSEKAEARYLEKAVEAADDEGVEANREKLLSMGYETCAHMLGSKDKASAVERIKDVTKESDVEALLISLRETASTTICPEYASF